MTNKITCPNCLGLKAFCLYDKKKPRHHLLYLDGKTKENTNNYILDKSNILLCDWYIEGELYRECFEDDDLCIAMCMYCKGKGYVYWIDDLFNNSYWKRYHPNKSDFEKLNVFLKTNDIRDIERRQ